MTFTDVVTCGKCGGADTDLGLTRCPADGTVLGERSMTDAELARIRPFGGRQFHDLDEFDRTGFDPLDWACFVPDE